MPIPQQIARVAVDEATWAEFRHAAIIRGIPVSTYLAKLVQAELDRRGASPVARIHEDDSVPDTALDALATVRASIDELDDIAGRLARTAVGAGASWLDVGAALGLTEPAARSAYRSDSNR